MYRYNRKATIFLRPIDEDYPVEHIHIPEAERGDILLDSNQWRIRENQNPEGDYRHHGIFIYDGTKFIGLETKYNDYGTIPDEFSIIDFPPTYWSHVLNYDSSVAFDVHKHLGKLDVKHLQMIIRKDGKGYHLVYPFVNIDGQVYGIVDAAQKYSDNHQGFIDDIQNRTHFKSYIRDVTPNMLGAQDENDYDILLLVDDDLI